MAEIEAKAIFGGFADDAGNDEGGNLEIEVGVALVAEVPEDVSAGAAFAIGCARVHGEGGRAAGDGVGNGKLQFVANCGEGLVEVGELLFARGEVGVVDVSVVGVQAGDADAGQCGKKTVEFQSARAG